MIRREGLGVKYPGKDQSISSLEPMSAEPIASLSLYESAAPRIFWQWQFWSSASPHLPIFLGSL